MIPMMRDYELSSWWMNQYSGLAERVEWWMRRRVDRWSGGKRKVDL